MVILASRSPRRRELIKTITNDFISIDSKIDEKVSFSLLNPIDICLDIAKRKGEAVKNLYPNDIIISADTIVVLDNQIIGKPKDENDAERILKKLSDKTHDVITAYYICKNEKEILNYVITKVTFNKLTNELIKNYIESGSPLDKAGAYGIQDNDKFNIIRSYMGSLDNVIGFPVKEIKDDYIKIKENS